ncbi:hypothetical protein D8674_039239 [Pyrus ussuriensis x Pyrus communis]|uniref:At2g29880-like C-terminal domain-containing protein n=1 Tax=Pyrus ussuriensis x Pyrus communis TaxID=2448454 RepID=A0A5N5IF16_9ROSA|nr:hypothetical protein D8674_039239 [Pyrus ussuriensis x Pyrus communis]
MGDLQQEKGKGNYNQWFVEESNMLLQLLVEAVKNGWSKIVPVLNEKLGRQKTQDHVKNRLFRHSSGFGWDSVTKKFTTSVRKERFVDYEDLMTVFGDGTTKGNKSIRLGNDTDGITYRVKESRPIRVNEFPPLDESFKQLDPLFQTPSYSELKSNGTTPHIVLIEKVSLGVGSIAAIATEIHKEEKNNNVWDAIKENPNLDAPIHYKAITLVQHS